MALLHHRHSRLLLSMAVMGCLCLPASNHTFAKGHKQAVSRPAQRKAHRPPAKKNQRTPIPVHKGWTEHEPASHEFTVPDTEPSNKHSFIGISADEKKSLQGNGYGQASVPTVMPSVFRSASMDYPSHPVRTDIAGNPAPGPSYDGAMKSYAFGPASFELNYERQNDRALETTRNLLTGKRPFGINQNRFIESPMDRDAWHVGMNYAVGKGSFNAAVDYTRMRNDSESVSSETNPSDLQSITFGYTHNVSENTSFYGSVTHTEYNMDSSNGNTDSTPVEDSRINQVNVGIKHRF